MTPQRDARICWVVLSMGDRPEALRQACESLRPDEIVLVANGAEVDDASTLADTVVVLPENVGIPGGRDVGLRAGRAPIVAFLDDDAVAPSGVGERIASVFENDPDLGAVALRLVDERGATSRRHVPRPGSGGADREGDVAGFLGGACAIRRAAYLDVGGYFGDLFYGHEEVELAWRLIDRGWRIRYLSDIAVFHPRTDIGRHASAWEMTGRNRVWVARRTLPWPVAAVHVSTWFVLGLVRAPGRANRVAYVRGWVSGWRATIERQPISWRGVWRLCRLGRPPII